MAFNLMRRPELNFLKNFKIEDIAQFRHIVIECVLATDLAKSMSWVSAARASLVLESSPEQLGIKIMETDPKKILADKVLRMQLAIKCADVGHPSRGLELHLKWSARISEEFFNQGDLEKSQGMKISPMCDRTVSPATYPQGQLGFINFVCRPVFSLLDAVCSSDVEKPWLTCLNNNTAYWEGRKKEELEKLAANATTPGV
jgi:hypothetical protein